MCNNTKDRISKLNQELEETEGWLKRLLGHEPEFEEVELSFGKVKIPSVMSKERQRTLKVALSKSAELRLHLNTISYFYK